jgi:transposase
MSDSKNFEVITATAERLSVSPGRSYRTWSRDEKDRIVGETFSPGANVSAIARSHGLDPSQLFAWRRKALGSGMVAPLSEARGQAVKFLDFRKGAMGLMALVRDGGADPFSGALYVFRSKRADRIKAVWWDGSGVCLFAKTLEETSRPGCG